VDVEIEGDGECDEVVGGSGDGSFDNVEVGGGNGGSFDNVGVDSGTDGNGLIFMLDVLDAGKEFDFVGGVTDVFIFTTLPFSFSFLRI
jgi:hypothetical protein